MTLNITWALGDRNRRIRGSRASLVTFAVWGPPELHRTASYVTKAGNSKYIEICCRIDEDFIRKAQRYREGACWIVTQDALLSLLTFSSTLVPSPWSQHWSPETQDLNLVWMLLVFPWDPLQGWVSSACLSSQWEFSHLLQCMDNYTQF